MGYFEEVLADVPGVYHRLDDVTNVQSELAEDSSGNNRDLQLWNPSSILDAAVQSGGPTPDSPGSVRMQQGNTVGSVSSVPLALQNLWNLSSTFNPFTGFRTYEIWTKLDHKYPDPLLRMPFATSGNTPDWLYCYIRADLGHVVWSPRGNQAGALAAVWSAAYPLDGRWHHFAITHDDSTPTTSTAELFIDGVSKGTQPCSRWQTSLPGFAYTVGNWYQSGWFWPWVGWLSDHAIYPSKLSAERIAAHYNAGATGWTYPKLIKSHHPLLHWRLGSGGVDDQSPHNNDGTTTGGLTLGGAAGAIKGDADGATDFDGIDDWITSLYGVRRNLITNPQFILNTTGWTGTGISGPTRVVAPSQAPTGGPGTMCYAQCSGSGSSQRCMTPIPVVSGQTYRLSFWVAVPAFTGTGAIRVEVMDSLNNVIASSGSTNSSAWQRMNVQFTAAATENYNVGIRMVGTGTCTWWMTAGLAELGSTLGSYFDGLLGVDTVHEGTFGASVSAKGPFANGSVRSFEGWANRDSSAAFHALLGDSNGVTYLRAASGGPPSDVQFSPAGTPGIVTWTGAWPANGQFVHWVLVFNEVTDIAELFIDGKSKGTKSGLLAYSASAGTLMAARRGISEAFDGKMDEFAVYDRALSAAEIEHHYRLGVGAPAFPIPRRPAERGLIMR